MTFTNLYIWECERFFSIKLTGYKVLAFTFSNQIWVFDIFVASLKQESSENIFLYIVVIINAVPLKFNACGVQFYGENINHFTLSCS